VGHCQASGADSSCNSSIYSCIATLTLTVSSSDGGALAHLSNHPEASHRRVVIAIFAA